VRVRVLDHVAQASTYEDGAVIYSLLESAVMANMQVELSFDGILAVTSAFVNATIVKLLEIAPLSVIQDSIRIVDSTRQINELVRQRVRFVAGAVHQGSGGAA
jgi:STAS-like domain of unknown function (DUF4325)